MIGDAPAAKATAWPEHLAARLWPAPVPSLPLLSTTGT